MGTDDSSIAGIGAPADPARQALVQAMEGRIVLTMSEAARMLRIGERSLRRKCRRGEITFVVQGGGAERPRRLFAIRDIEDFLEKRQRAAQPAAPAAPAWLARVTVSHAPKRKSRRSHDG